MLEEDVLGVFKNRGAVLTGHFRLRSGKHSNIYIDKDALNPDTQLVYGLCIPIADHFRILSDIDTVVAPAVGAIALCRATAEYLTNMLGLPVWAVYAERDESSLFPGADASPGVIEVRLKEKRYFGLEKSVLLNKGQEEIVLKRSTFVIRRGQEKYVKDKNILVVEDIITTGGSVKKVVEAVNKAGGMVIGVGCIVNRGDSTAMNLGVPELFSLIDMPFKAWPESECQFCKDKVALQVPK